MKYFHLRAGGSGHGSPGHPLPTLPSPLDPIPRKDFHQSHPRAETNKTWSSFNHPNNVSGSSDSTKVRPRSLLPRDLHTCVVSAALAHSCSQRTRGYWIYICIHVHLCIHVFMFLCSYVYIYTHTQPFRNVTQWDHQGEEIIPYTFIKLSYLYQKLFQLWLFCSIPTSQGRRGREY